MLWRTPGNCGRAGVRVRYSRSSLKIVTSNLDKQQRHILKSDAPWWPSDLSVMAVCLMVRVDVVGRFGLLFYSLMPVTWK